MGTREFRDSYPELIPEKQVSLFFSVSVLFQSLIPSLVIDLRMLNLENVSFRRKKTFTEGSGHKCMQIGIHFHLFGLISFSRWSRRHDRRRMSSTRDDCHAIHIGAISRYGLSARINQEVAMHGGIRRPARRSVHVQSASAVLQHDAHRYGTSPPRHGKIGSNSTTTTCGNE